MIMAGFSSIMSDVWSADAVAWSANASGTENKDTAGAIRLMVKESYSDVVKRDSIRE
jgi:hypothetical protein